MSQRVKKNIIRVICIILVIAMCGASVLVVLNAIGII